LANINRSFTVGTFSLLFRNLVANQIYEIHVGTTKNINEDTNAKSGYFNTFNQGN
jgi:hypothetical protein